MLSRIAVNPARSVLAVQQCRLTQTSSNQAAPASPAVAVQEGAERDLVNFPRPVRLIEPAKVRLGFIPEEWFQFFYAKTGVTGPYVFGVGLSTYLLSKEIYIMEHEFYTGLSLGVMALYAVKKFGPPLAAYLDKQVEKSDAEISAGRDEAMKASVDAIAAEKVEQERAAAQMMLFEAKKENVALQLEAAYREQLLTVYHETKRRLDYQVECQNVARNMEQRNVVDYVIRSVKAAVTPELEKASLAQCVANIKALAKENTARI